jgi:NAD(P)H-dependent FMN reductase
MRDKKKILAICGSTKSSSINLCLIRAIADLTTGIFDVTIFNHIDKIPHFNPGLDNENPPDEVRQFRNLIKEASGVLICTPEYAMGVPGSLKNAIDWTVSTCDFSDKPVVLITASSHGFKGHQALLETLKIIECNITDETQLVIPFVKAKVSYESKITDQKTLDEVNKLIIAFSKLTKQPGEKTE